MINAFLALGVFSTLLAFLLLSVIAGRKFGMWQITNKPQHKLEVVNVAEGAVFALLGLLIAFTFSGAYERFELRKLHIIEEANTFATAYQRIDLLSANSQPALRASFREYLDARLATYKAIPDFDQVAIHLKKSKLLEAQIWKQAVAAFKIPANQDVKALLVPAISNMFEIANTGFSMTKIHPPLIIFGLLIGLAILGGFLAGYTTAESTVGNSIHILSYVIIIAFIIYVIMDLEVPRVGLIRVDSFDQIVMDVREEWN